MKMSKQRQINKFKQHTNDFISDCERHTSNK
jgi:hypothetical protein